MSRLKKALKDILDDQVSIEVAVLEETDDHSTKVLSYSKTEIEGDTIAYSDQSISDEQVKLHREMLLTASKNRMSLINMIQSIL